MWGLDAGLWIVVECFTSIDPQSSTPVRERELGPCFLFPTIALELRRCFYCLRLCFTVGLAISCGWYSVPRVVLEKEYSSLSMWSEVRSCRENIKTRSRRLGHSGVPVPSVSDSTDVLRVGLSAVRSRSWPGTTELHTLRSA